MIINTNPSKNMTSDYLKNRRNKLLFTPGPLTTLSSVKEAAFYDLGSRDRDFIDIIRAVRTRLLNLAHASDEFDSIIIQGSGTYGIESVISSSIPGNGMLLNIINGAYGHRISKIARIHGIPLTELECDENQLPDPGEIESALRDNPGITHISVVHCETTTGILNPLTEIAEIAGRFNKALIVDAMSSFGAYEIDVAKLKISYLISSSNKCIEGIPGFSFVIASRMELEKCRENSRTLSLDLYDQWCGLNGNGQFRFTPPVQVILAFNQALDELEAEGGIRARGIRYRDNNELLVKGMSRIGFRLYLPEQLRSYIITSFLYPEHKSFSFNNFYERLSEKGFVIYPGKLSTMDCFRIGNIGQLHQIDMHMLLDAIQEVLFEMKINIK
jgi:2-aminoethylphosphonate-pyruvate transaminase